MTHSPPEPPPSGPAVQRVPAGTRGPLVAAALVVVTIGVLIAKPWEPPASSGSPNQSSIDVAQIPANSPEPTEEAQASSRSPDVASGAGGSGAGGSGAIYTLEIGDPGDVARCLYGATRQGELRLGAVLVEPPLAYVPAASGSERTRRVEWRVELQSNRPESLFNAEWKPVSESRLQIVEATDGTAAHFFPVEVQVDAASVSRTSMIRARLIVDWYSPNTAEFHRADMLMPGYVLGGRRTGPIRDSCPGFTEESF